MRILLLTHGFNSLTQRLFVELTGRGHELSVEFDIADSVTEEAVALFRPDLILAPYLRRAIPESIWMNHVCLVVHPGIPGDRGPSALDRAIQDGETEWGVTLLQANAVMDGGDIWVSRNFPTRQAMKSSLYRNEVTEAATQAVLDALAGLAAGNFKPLPLAAAKVRGRERPLLGQEERAIHWTLDDTLTVLRKIHAGDGFPGVKDRLFGEACFLHDAHAAEAASGEAGAILGRSGHGLIRATTDGAVWIGHVRRPDGPHPFKLPVSQAFPLDWAALPELSGAPEEIRYGEADGVGYLHFDFYNGAMATEQCRGLQAAVEAARRRPIRVLVLMGGRDFWSNGIHLNRIEAAESPAEESMANIEAMDDLALALLTTDGQLTVAALGGNAGAGGCFLALACDVVWARPGVILNPHYKNMGNLYGSEYWTYSLPKRVGEVRARAILQNRLPLGAADALVQGIIEEVFAGDGAAFRREVKARAAAMAASADFPARLEAKATARRQDEAQKPLANYRDEELAEMRRNFFGFDPSYHVARFHFVHKSLVAWTPRHLARHRDA